MAKKNEAAPVPRRDAHDVAAAIIRMTEGNGKPISNLQLQKLLYLCQFAYAWEHGSPMFENRIEAWQYGPVVPEVYHEYSYRGASSLHTPHTRKRVWQPYPVCKFMNVPVDELDEGAMAVVKSIVGVWGEASVWDLVNETHKPGSPWDTVYNRGGEGAGYGEEIDPMLYADWYDPETHSVRAMGAPLAAVKCSIPAYGASTPDEPVDAPDAPYEESDPQDRVPVLIRLPADAMARAEQLAAERGQEVGEWLDALVERMLSAL